MSAALHLVRDDEKDPLREGQLKALSRQEATARDYSQHPDLTPYERARWQTFAAAIVSMKADVEIGRARAEARKREDENQKARIA